MPSRPTTSGLPPPVTAWKRRKKLKLILAICIFVLAAACINLYVFSLLFRWSTYVVTSPVEPYGNSTGIVPPTGANSVARWETHLLIGQGKLRLHTMYVYTASDPGFDTPGRDDVEASLAWSTAANDVSWPEWHSNWGNGWPMANLPLWIPAFATGSLAAWLLARILSKPKPWQCAGCRYDLRAQVVEPGQTLKCPECGRDRRCIVCAHPTIGPLAQSQCTECGWTA